MDSIIMTLNKVSRDSDCIGKFGPKHVLFVCIETNEQGAQLFAQRLTKEINKHNNKNNIGLDCKISLSELKDMNDANSVVAELFKV